MDSRIYRYKSLFNLEINLISKAIVDELLEYVNKKGVAFPSQERIAKSIGVARETVSRKIKELEQLKINGLPFLIKSQRRACQGKYNHNVYYLPWVAHMNTYLREHQINIIKQLEEEFRGIWEYEVLQESTNQQDRVIGDNKNLKRQNYYIYIANLVKKLRTLLNLSSEQILKFLSNIGAELSNNKTCIYHMDRYVSKSLLNAGAEQNVVNKLKEIYSILCDHGKNSPYNFKWWQRYENII